MAPKNFRQVHEHGGRNIFVSGEPDREHLEWLRNQGVRHIMSAAPEPGIQEAWEKTGGHYHPFDYNNLWSGEIARGIEAAERWKNGEGHLLVHCNKGEERSPVVAYTVLRRLGVPAEEAKRKVLTNEGEFKMLDDVFEMAEKTGIDEDLWK